jgi:type II secretory pathway pseudopilin PulG
MKGKVNLIALMAVLATVALLYFLITAFFLPSPRITARRDATYACMETIRAATLSYWSQYDALPADLATLYRTGSLKSSYGELVDESSPHKGLAFTIVTLGSHETQSLDFLIVALRDGIAEYLMTSDGRRLEIKGLPIQRGNLQAAGT